MKKMCGSCRNPLDIKFFHKDSNASDGRQRICKACSRDIGMEDYSNRKEDYSRINKEWVKNNPDKHRESCKKYMARNRDDQVGKRQIRAEKYKAMWESGELKLPHSVECKECGETKTIDNYYINKSNKKGYNATCKQCQSERNRKKHEDSRVKMLTTRDDEGNVIHPWKRAYNRPTNIELEEYKKIKQESFKNFGGVEWIKWKGEEVDYYE